ncbi:hypothetical protein SAMN05444413_10746 [Roseivivax marinus]|uniref:hypothetical protein n=1 Tax=Roseivivax marinus TaxID=1379903 RepID=UPI0008D5EF3F|nr:hypothetical protein [Roseivivax marinus]SEL23831.1 hypothetical protein SAMN05444413_10746 [Roseivivax marinus]
MRPAALVALVALGALAACGGPKSIAGREAPSAEARLPNRILNDDAPALRRQRAERDGEVLPADPDGGVATTGYVEMGVGSGGATGSGGVLMRRGNFTFGFEL